METNIIEVATTSAVSAKVTPMDLLRHAMDSGADLDRLEKLMDLQDRWESNEARKAFASAMTDFKLAPPKVFKDKTVSYGAGNGKTEYTHATLGNSTDTIIAALAKHGFSHRWITTQRDGLVIVDCVITHRLGHSQTNTLQSSPDKSGGKNDIQAIVSARSYLERHSLFDATGLAPMDGEDDDGAGAAALDTSLADKWIADAGRASTLDALKTIWNDGSAAIQRRGTDYDLVDFKAAVNSRKAQLTPAEPNKSSRLRDIVGAGQVEVLVETPSMQAAE